ncbi:hypothetical protein IIC38_12115 [candidate division KSB1 bacterium]|nr:hypothetical protein [candidate division KSB1 bacterium]
MLGIHRNTLRSRMKKYHLQSQNNSPIS